MIEIEVRTDEVRTVTGVSKRTGQPYTIRDQEGYAFTCDKDGKPKPYPERVSLSLEDNQPPYKPGRYILSPGSVYVGDFGRLMLGRPVLLLKPAARAVA